MAGILLLLIAMVGAIRLALATARAWHDPNASGENTPFLRTLPVSRSAKLRMGRAVLTLAVAYGFLLAFVVLAFMWNSVHVIDKESFQAIGRFFIGGFVMFIVVSLVVATSGMPKFLIPPPQRR